MGDLRETEEGFKGWVTDLAKHCGWLVHHDRPSRRADGSWRTAVEGDAGFPDLVLARDGRVIFAELKTERGKPSPAQDRWMLEIRGRYDTSPCYLWRPSDRPEIARVLA
jgi:hypothetical protein